MSDYTTKEFASYLVTGTDTRGHRFRIVTTNYVHARGINVYRGTLWGILVNGKRVRLATYHN